MILIPVLLSYEYIYELQNLNMTVHFEPFKILTFMVLILSWTDRTLKLSGRMFRFSKMIIERGVDNIYRRAFLESNIV